MNKIVVVMMLALGFSAVQAQADGFTCETQRGDLRIQVYNHTNPNAGTRNAAIMILSDPAINYGKKTIAKFTDVKATLDNRGADYVARVDLRVSESNRKGEYLLGTRLGYLDAIYLNIDFSYGTPVARGAIVKGEIIALKRNGEKISHPVTCRRYLKN